MMLVYGAAGIAITGAVVFAIMFGINMLKSEDVLANTTYSSIANGNWLNSNTWLNGTLPEFGNNKQTVITSGDTVYYDGDFSASSAKASIIVEGTLIFTQSVSLGTHATIDVKGTGTLIVIGEYTASNHLDVQNGGIVIFMEAVDLPDKHFSVSNSGSIFSDESFNLTSGSNNIQSLSSIPLSLKNLIAFYSDPINLPIELLHFTAESTQRGVQLRWATAAEINNDFFTIERTRDGKNYEKITTLPGAGNSKVQLNYDFTDTRPYSGTSYYRLTQTDFDGTSESFPLVTVVHNGLQGEMSLKISKGYPNPFQDQLTLSFFTEEEGQTELTILNSRGDRVYSETILAYAGENEVIFRDGHRLPTDTYLVYLAQNGEQTKPYRVVKR
jgi:hypothetical protein